MILLQCQKNKLFFSKGYSSTLVPKFLWLKKLKTLFFGHAITDPKGEKYVGTFYGKELPKTNQKEFKVEKVTKIKEDKLYVKWKGYNSSFNSWIHKKDIV